MQAFSKLKDCLIIGIISKWISQSTKNIRNIIKWKVCSTNDSDHGLTDDVHASNKKMFVQKKIWDKIKETNEKYILFVKVYMHITEADPDISIRREKGRGVKQIGLQSNLF